MTPSQDDIVGSPGVVRMNSQGQPVLDPVFGFEVQVTDRASPSFFTSQYAREVFWDGRAASHFRDPDTGTTIIPLGGTLESQILEPILSAVEMAHEGRTWGDVTAKLAGVVPLALASELPLDMADALAGGANYPALFDAAFGDATITGARIAMAIATYERTLWANQSPWDVFNAGDPSALSQNQRSGLDAFVDGGCAVCHAPPFFSDHSFRNIGLRPVAEDAGREGVTGNAQEAGRMKVPSLRNVGLKPTFMRTGQFSSLHQVLDFYREANGQQQFEDNKDPAIDDLDIPASSVNPLIDFLMHGLTDPRVASESFPFDRPTLASERTVTGVGDDRAARKPVRMHRAVPNPFNPSTELAFELTGAGSVTLDIFDLSGRRVRTLIDATYPSGLHHVRWDGLDSAGASAASGVYLARVRSGEHVDSQRLVLLK